MNGEFQMVVDVIQQVGMYAIFAFLYIQERKAHDMTRQRWLEDLREIAGMKQHLTRSNGVLVSEIKRTQEMPMESN